MSDKERGTTANPNPGGLTTEYTGATQRPRDAANNVPPVSPLNRVAVHDEELIELEGLDPDSLDPDRVYRLVPFKNHPLVRRRMRQGYVIEKLSEGGVRPNVKEHSDDGSIKVGDRVLMSCPRSLWLERRARNFRFSETRLQNVATGDDSNFKKKVADLQSQGVRTALIDENRQVVETVQEREE